MKTQKESNILCSAIEAAKLRRHITGVEELHYAHKITELYGCKPIDQPDNWNLMIMISDVFNAGRISGIRQERRRRAAHG